MNNKYPWSYCSIGGVTRVRLSSGEDIAHLGELDQKLWTVLSCPVDGLIFDKATLEFLDSDKDGKIKVGEVVAASEWTTALLKDKDLLLRGADSLPIDQIETSAPDGQKLYDCARQILATIGVEKSEITLADAAASAASVAQAAHKAWEDQRTDEMLPYGEDTPAALAACEAVSAKLADYFMRCKLVAFDNKCAGALDVSVSGMDDLASCPLSHPRADGVLDLSDLNPAWAPAFATLKAKVSDLPGELTEAAWTAIIGKFSAYKAWKGAEPSAAADTSGMAELNKFMHFYRHLYEFLNNYVVFGAFYDPDKLSVFEAGRLYIDQRCLSLCIKVSDMGKHGDMAAQSGMFILYCDCVSKPTGKTATIAAVLTNGDVDNLRVGMNAIFYDRDGVDYDAVVTKIVDNPVSVRQAFFSPYKKLARTITDRINKNAAEKEAKAAVSLDEKSKNPQGGFDIAKFAGIFAAIGMAVSFLATAIAAIVKPWYTPLIVLAVLFLCISGPSMFIAWTKLRKRNLGPVLNANGWAINSVVIVNILFGATLTSLAKYPKLAMKNDPYAKKKSAWPAIITVVVILAAAVAALYFTGNLDWLK